MTPTPQERGAAWPYLVAAWLARGMVGAALGFGLYAFARWGPIGGLVAGVGAVWLARLAKPPMPPDLRRKFD